MSVSIKSGLGLFVRLSNSLLMPPRNYLVIAFLYFIVMSAGHDILSSPSGSAAPSCDTCPMRPPCLSPGSSSHRCLPPSRASPGWRPARLPGAALGLPEQRRLVPECELSPRCETASGTFLCVRWQSTPRGMEPSPCGQTTGGTTKEPSPPRRHARPAS